MPMSSAKPHKRIAIVQSNYIPWKGYFDLIASVDAFVLYDDVQYTRRDWRNRNKIKTIDATQWLTIPVKVKGKYEQTIRQTELDGDAWQKTHWKSLLHHYRKAACFDEVAAFIAPLYEASYSHLSQVNRAFMVAICNYLGIRTVIHDSAEYTLAEGKSARLADLCLQAGGTEYVSGPSAKDYIEPSVFAAAGVTLSWFEYEGYPAYPQLGGEFVHAVSILDLLFNCGKDAPNYMKYVPRV